MVEKTKSWTRIIILCGIILLAAAAIITWSQRGDDPDEATEAAYSQGYYDYAYELLEDTWHDSRLALIHATLVVNTCDGGTPYCKTLEDERDKMAARELPSRLTEGSQFDFDRAVIPVDSEVRMLNASIRYLDHNIALIEETAMDDKSADLIEEAVSRADYALRSISSAEKHLTDSPDDTAVRESKEQLEAVLAQHQAERARSNWGIPNLERALAELEEASRALEDALSAM